MRHRHVSFFTEISIRLSGQQQHRTFQSFCHMLSFSNISTDLVEILRMQHPPSKRLEIDGTSLGFVVLEWVS